MENLLLKTAFVLVLAIILGHTSFANELYKFDRTVEIENAEICSVDLTKETEDNSKRFSVSYEEDKTIENTVENESLEVSLMLGQGCKVYDSNGKLVASCGRCNCAKLTRTVLKMVY